MSKAMFHTNDEGKTLPCDSPDNCPFGSHDSASQSQAAYETKMNAHQFATVRPVKQNELNVIAKTSSNPEELQRALELGGVRVTSNLVRNPHLTPEQLVALEGKITDSALKRTIVRHENYPLSNLSLEKIRTLDHRRLQAALNSPELDDDLAEKLCKITSVEPIFSDKNKVTKEKAHEILLSSSFGRHYKTVENTDKFDLSLVVEHLDARGLQTVFSDSSNPDNIRAAYSQFEKQQFSNEILEYVPYNKNTPDDVIEKLLDNDKAMENPNIGLSIYKSNYTNDSARNRAVEKSATARSLQKVDKLGERGELNGITSGPSYSGKKHSYAFDKERVKDLGLDSTDIDNIVVNRYNNKLFGVEYNPTTGVYSGYIE